MTCSVSLIMQDCACGYTASLCIPQTDPVSVSANIIASTNDATKRK